MRIPELCLRVFTVRRVIAVATICSIFATMGAFYHSEPLRTKALETVEHLSQSIHSSVVDMTAARAQRSTLDIIVSMYKEDTGETAAQIKELLALDPIREVEEVTVTIYVKDRNADTEAIKAATGADEVVQLSNYGREGGTFLTHIIMNFDYLARHTMFVQAKMHSFDEAKNKINDYFINNTGVLNLGFLEGCECVACKDPWDQERRFPRLPQLYSALNGKMCPKHITLSYLGQMIVSAERIRSRPRQIYKHLRAVLESDMEHFIHDDPRQEWAFADDPSEPYFGHTLERSWMVLWGCEDTKILNGCGGWEGLGRRRGVDEPYDKCQCLDGGR